MTYIYEYDYCPCPKCFGCICPDECVNSEEGRCECQNRTLDNARCRGKIRAQRRTLNVEL